MKKKGLLVALLLSMAFSYNYSVGEFISESDQNLTKSTCYDGNEYTVGDDWKLADWNGAANGGHYSVTFIDMSATW